MGEEGGINPPLTPHPPLTQVYIKEGKALNHLIDMKERIIRLLKVLENQDEISEKERNDLHPSGSIWAC